MSARPTPGADQAATELRKAVEQPYQQARARAHELGAMRTAMNGTTDLVLLLGAINNLSLAAEALEKAAKELHTAADAALTAAMTQTGCSTFASAGLTVSLCDGRRGIEIVDAAAIPPAYMTTPQPIPDRRKIAAMLKERGAAVNWAKITTGAPYLRRTTT